ncbi:MAG: DUF3821 domain-containing protein [Treponema sp.]|nr:DUF3821 domain-containing protein [Treponema sp.]
MSDFAMPKLKDTAIFFGWIAGLLVIGGLCFFLTGSLRSDLLQSSINRAWAQSGVAYRLQAPADPGSVSPALSRLGSWYTIDEENRALVFTLVSDGIFLPCAAIVDSQGKTVKMLPLSSSGDKIFDRVPDKVKLLYQRRIENGGQS